MAVRTTVDIKTLRTTARWSQELLARLLGVSWTTISRWERGVAIPSSETEERLERLAIVQDCIGEMMEPDTLADFLLTPHPMLRGHKPVDLLKNEYGLEALIDFIEGAKSGDMA